MAVTFTLGLPDGAALTTDNFQVRSVKPELVRKIGTRISREEIVSPYADPVWKIIFRIGPLATDEGQRLRNSIGRIVPLQIDDTSGRDRPNADVWIGPVILAEILDVRQRRLGMDITQGERFDVYVQFPQSRIG